MKFHIAMLSFVSSAQKILQKPEFEGPPIELAEKLLMENVKYTPKKSGFIGLYFGDFIGDYFWIVKLAGIGYYLQNFNES